MALGYRTSIVLLVVVLLAGDLAMASPHRSLKQLVGSGGGKYKVLSGGTTMNSEGTPAATPAADAAAPASSSGDTPTRTPATALTRSSG